MSNSAEDASRPQDDCGGRFSQPRTICLAGYYDAPSIATGMSFELRQLPIVSSRIVRLGTTVLELWSPNSLQLPFLPGVARTDYRVTAPATLISQRRYDGHGGKHDCLHVPQYFRASAAYWPFMRRVLEVPPNDRAYVAYAPITSYWHADASYHPSPRGYLNPSFVADVGDLERLLETRIAPFQRRLHPGEWERRPRAVNESAIARLLAVRMWDDAVDQGVAIQRALREREAWATWHEERVRQSRLSLEDLRSMDMALAREEYTGLWVNGLDEQITLFFMAAGVPCFIAHSYAPGEVVRDTGLVFNDLVGGTDVESSLSDDNPYQRLARLQIGRTDAIPTADDGRGRARPASAKEENLSSSLYLESLDRPPLVHPSWLGYNRPGLPPYRAPPVAAPAQDYQRRAKSVTPPIAPPKAAGAARNAPSDLPNDTLPEVPRAEEDRYAARPIERRSVDANRVDWVVPPAIPRNWSKEWSKWELDEWAGVTAWVGRGKHRAITSEHVWYDRERGRQLFFNDLVLPEGCIDVQRYGVPVPRFPFYFDNGGSGRASKASYWMYPKREGVKREEGKRLGKPAATLLPLKVKENPKDAEGRLSSDSSDSDDSSSGPPDSGYVAKRGKGKAKAESPSSDGSEGGEVHAMDVDEEPPVSNVIALSGVDPQVTSLMFRALAADVLYAVRARPLGMVHGQGRMWLRFDSITEARRAFGALMQMSGDLAGSFEPDGAFHDAYTYSRDRWTVQTTGDLGPAETPSLANVSAVEPARERVDVDARVAAQVPEVPERSSAARALAPAAPASPGEDVSSRPGRPPTPLPAVVPASSAAIRAARGPVVAPRRGDERPRAASPPTPPPQASTSFVSPAPALRASQAIPTAPRSMRATERAFRRLTLGERLTGAPASPSESDAQPRRAASLVDRLTAPLADRLSDPVPLAQRLGPPPMATSGFHDSVVASKRARSRASDNSEEPPARKKVRRGKRAGRQTREQEEIRARFRAEAEAITQRAEETHDPELLSWVPVLDLAAEMEVDEDAARAIWMAEDEEDMDISPAIAGPSNSK
ncbi:hypothetical protein B0H15DRAFT_943888 [Mycena belliarum]|uniref:Uncharacterized protein n=1 Tax=Mycena belliarum TaxID=1033014 RepID=A0AAD6UIW2_9AGAR|nr:hypothetical protein B0H15DRAFT_943888 [Mycena belliae]